LRLTAHRRRLRDRCNGGCACTTRQCDHRVLKAPFQFIRALHCLLDVVGSCHWHVVRFTIDRSATGRTRCHNPLTANVFVLLIDTERCRSDNECRDSHAGPYRNVLCEVCIDGRLQSYDEASSERVSCPPAVTKVRAGYRLGAQNFCGHSPSCLFSRTIS
jgi:hypothetical protein